jgi:endonuclease-3
MTTTGLKTNKILKYLDELYPNPKCELNYNKDYELLIAIVLSAQTTDKRVNKVTNILFNKYKTLDELNNAPVKEIANIIKEIGTFNKKSIYVKKIVKKLVEDNNYVVPNDRTYLESLPGVGRKTANVFLSNIYNVPAIAVDTHVSRVSKRLGLTKSNDTVDVIEQKLMKKIPKDKWSKTHHQLVLFGRYKCKALTPDCTNCELKEFCKYKNSQESKS